MRLGETLSAASLYRGPGEAAFNRGAVSEWWNSSKRHAPHPEFLAWLPAGGHTRYAVAVKVAVSIPDPLFSEAERLARRRKLSRSQLYAQALEVLLSSDDDSEITRRLDAVHARQRFAARRRVAQRASRRRPRSVVTAAAGPRRCDVYWAELREPTGSEPGYRRPVLVVSADSFNRSRISTVVVVAISSNTGLAAAPGNVELPAADSGLPRDSVANVSQILTLDKNQLADRAGAVDFPTMRRVEAGLRLVAGDRPMTGEPNQLSKTCPSSNHKCEVITNSITDRNVRPLASACFRA